MNPQRRLFLQARLPAQAPRAHIGASCLAHRRIECRVCGDLCDARAIRFRPRLGSVAQPMLDELACTACGDCVTACPAGAISLGAGRTNAGDTSDTCGATCA